MIFVYGDAALDIVVEANEPICYGSDTRASIRFTGGGSPANFAARLAALGAEVRFFYKTGDDLAGDYLERDLNRPGIRGERLVERDETTGKIIIFVDRSGERTMITDRGASLTFYPEELPEEEVKKAEHLHLTGYNFYGAENLVQTAKSTIKAAKESSTSISIDPSSYALLEDFGPDRFLKLTSNLDLALPNRDEGEVLTGRKKPKEIISELRKSYKIVALKLGPEGCMVASGEDITRVDSDRAVARPDTTGAGDAFDAGFLFSLLNLGDPVEAGKKANRIAAEAVRTSGGRT